MTIPYLTADLPGTGGRIKTKTDDFIVREIPLYPASGQGIHVYFTIEKRGISTLSAVNMIARALGRKTMEIGYAGLKDTQAVARQTFSIEHESHTRIAALELPQIRILEVTRHQNKLKIGHLAGNHFTIKIRNDQWAIAGGSVADAGQKATAVLQRLATTGVPNFFGPQRFGMRGDNHQLGLSLLRGRSQIRNRHSRSEAASGRRTIATASAKVHQCNDFCRGSRVGAGWLASRVEATDAKGAGAYRGPAHWPASI